MSQIGFCPRGGMDGIQVDYDELRELSNILVTQWTDEYIPLPNVDMDAQVKRIKDDSHAPFCGEDVKYYENTEDGCHGWACTHCGKVVQWG